MSEYNKHGYYRLASMEGLILKALRKLGQRCATLADRQRKHGGAFLHWKARLHQGDWLVPSLPAEASTLMVVEEIHDTIRSQICWATVLSLRHDDGVSKNAMISIS